ncbi:MAG TPA: hypothetical protein V6D16_14265, partial [Candidatus Obscuribacterales bacterium]
MSSSFLISDSWLLSPPFSPFHPSSLILSLSSSHPAQEGSQAIALRLREDFVGGSGFFDLAL